MCGSQRCCHGCVVFSDAPGLVASLHRLVLQHVVVCADAGLGALVLLGVLAHPPPVKARRSPKACPLAQVGAGQPVKHSYTCRVPSCCSCRPLPAAPHAVALTPFQTIPCIPRAPIPTLRRIADQQRRAQSAGRRCSAPNPLRPSPIPLQAPATAFACCCSCCWRCRQHGPRRAARDAGAARRDGPRGHESGAPGRGVRRLGHPHARRCVAGAWVWGSRCAPVRCVCSLVKACVMMTRGDDVVVWLLACTVCTHSIPAWRHVTAWRCMNAATALPGPPPPPHPTQTHMTYPTPLPLLRRRPPRRSRPGMSQCLPLPKVPASCCCRTHCRSPCRSLPPVRARVVWLRADTSGAIRDVLAIEDWKVVSELGPHHRVVEVTQVGR